MREDRRGRDRDGWGGGGVREVENSELHYQIEILYNSLFLQSVMAKLRRHGYSNINKGRVGRERERHRHKQTGVNRDRYTDLTKEKEYRYIRKWWG